MLCSISYILSFRYSGVAQVYCDPSLASKWITNLSQNKTSIDITCQANLNWTINSGETLICQGESSH